MPSSIDRLVFEPLNDYFQAHPFDAEAFARELAAEKFLHLRKVPDVGTYFEIFVVRGVFAVAGTVLYHPSVAEANGKRLKRSLRGNSVIVNGNNSDNELDLLLEFRGEPSYPRAPVPVIFEAKVSNTDDTYKQKLEAVQGLYGTLPYYCLIRCGEGQRFNLQGNEFHRTIIVPRT